MNHSSEQIPAPRPPVRGRPCTARLSALSGFVALVLAAGCGSAYARAGQDGAPTQAPASLAADPASSAALIDTLQKQIKAQQALLQALQYRMGAPAAGAVSPAPASAAAGQATLAAVPADSSAGGALPLQPATVAAKNTGEPAASGALADTPARVATDGASSSRTAPGVQFVPDVPVVSGTGGVSGAGSASSAPAPASVPVTPASPVTITGLPDGQNMTAVQRMAYASGVSVWREIENSMTAQRSLGINLDPQYVMLGLKDMAMRQPLKMSGDAIENVNMTLNQMYMQKSQEVRDLQKKQGSAYRIAFSKQKGAKSDAGSWYQVLSRGTGRNLRTTDTVSLLVTGSLPDGTVFDASGQNGQAKTAKVGALLPAVAIGLQKLAPGGHIKIVVPPEKGYGDNGLPPAIPGGATLIFDIQVTGLSQGEG